MPPKRKSPRDTATANTKASKAGELLEPAPEVQENSISIEAVETGKT